MMMNMRWLGLVVLMLAIAATSPVVADVRNGEQPQDGERPSHRPVRTGLEDDLSPERRLANRLQNPRNRKDKIELDDGMKELAKRLLQDKDLLESLKKSINPNDINRLKRTIEANRDWANDPALRKLFEEGIGKNIFNDKDKDLIDRWKKTIENAGPPPNVQMPPMPLDQQPGKWMPPPEPIKPPVIPSPQQKIDPPAQQPSQQQMPDWMRKSIDRTSRDLTKWLDTPGGKSFRDNIRDMSKRFAETGKNLPPITERAAGTGRFLGKTGEWLLDRVRPKSPPRFGSLPRVNATLPRFGSPGAMPRVSASGVGQAILVVGATALVLFLIWHTRDMWQAAIKAGFAREWKLGGWPVKPEHVTTRGDLVNAFEHLALLCLGRSARTHHHLDLGKLIGEQPSLEPDRRREAAMDLARLYEKARYTPDHEPLSSADVADARRELTYLAKEAAA